MGEESLYIRLFNSLVLHEIDLIVEGPERDELALREPRVIEGQSNFYLVQSLFDILKASGDLDEKPAWAGHSLIYDPLIYLKVETD